MAMARWNVFELNALLFLGSEFTQYIIDAVIGEKD